MSRKEFAENERTLIRLLQDNESLSKSQLAQIGETSWATVVKMINRLQERGIVVVAGTEGKLNVPGKKGLLYSLSAEKPLAIGIDVGYDNTRIVLMNLRGFVLLESQCKTIQQPTIPLLTHFLIDLLTMFIEQIQPVKQHVVGIGIGLPGGVISAWLRPDAGDNRRTLQKNLCEQTGIPVVVEMNQRSYTNYIKWKGLFFPGEDFCFVSMRVGVGMGMILRGELFVGHQSIGTEIGHIKVSEKGNICRCGRTGCLESMISQSALFRRYEETVLKKRATKMPSTSVIVEGLHDLFSRAAEKQETAQSIIVELSMYLGKALSSCLLTVFVPNIVIGGYFGKHGGILLPLLEQELHRNLLPNMNVNLRYFSMEELPIAEGDAILALSTYLHSEVTQ